ncbi:hypothetical protein T069G_00605 [Trichoderma breve]|uniref:Uncharacterized protein n=1 Tax=Trichoderma breve TaxID=2034170 RepID=A0A9W9JQU5_9HYPO|nr:hypothetical protein T069G_00605 [Trichoderma breve]KAJ4864075.1 hypothetical protein T069G_00605 [Trichoderma breve]
MDQLPLTELQFMRLDQLMERLYHTPLLALIALHLPTGQLQSMRLHLMGPHHTDLQALTALHPPTDQPQHMDQLRHMRLHLMGPHHRMVPHHHTDLPALTALHLLTGQQPTGQPQPTSQLQPMGQPPTELHLKQPDQLMERRHPTPLQVPTAHLLMSQPLPMYQLQLMELHPMALLPHMEQPRPMTPPRLM